MFLAKNIRYLRLKYGLSQDYVAEKLGYDSYTTIQKWEGVQDKWIFLSCRFIPDWRNRLVVFLSAFD